jgi:hypothetical protein
MFGPVIALVTACGGASQAPARDPADSSSASSSSPASAAVSGTGTASQRKPAVAPVVFATGSGPSNAHGRAAGPEGSRPHGRAALA